MIVTLLALFAAPWTIAGLIHAPAAGMRGHSRGRIFGTGLAIFLVLMTVGVILHDPSQGAAPSSSTMTLAGLWMISMVAWPLAALIMRTRSRHAAVSPPTPAPAAKPWQGEKPKPLTAEQRKPLNLPARKTPAAAAPKPNRTTRAIRTGWSIGEVAFTYMDADGEVSSRRVTVHSATSSHLKGECHDRQAERTFRLDRIVGDLVDCETGELLSPKRWARQINAGSKT